MFLRKSRAQTIYLPTSSCFFRNHFFWVECSSFNMFKTELKKKSKIWPRLSPFFVSMTTIWFAAHACGKRGLGYIWKCQNDLFFHPLPAANAGYVDVFFAAMLVLLLLLLFQQQPHPLSLNWRLGPGMFFFLITRGARLSPTNSADDWGTKKNFCFAMWYGIVPAFPLFSFFLLQYVMMTEMGFDFTVTRRIVPLGRSDQLRGLEKLVAAA